MNIKEAIENAEDCVRFTMSENNWQLEQDDYYDEESLAVAIEAMEKQVPMKVYERPISDGTVQLECPSCHCEVRIEFLHPYCWHCGQAIDWED